jgi:glycosyltransferase involved in cell wall biosynthesis
MVIGSDITLYNRFAEFPENQKLYYPGLPYQVYPSFYKSCDVMVVPLEDNYFNRAKSDIKLLETEAAALTWVASPLPMYTEYWPYGLFATTTDEWYNQLVQLLDNRESQIDIENRIARVGMRRSEVMARKWEDLVNKQ